MRHSLSTLLLLLTALNLQAQTVNLRGKVTNQAGKPIAGAVVALLGQDLIDTTGVDGAYGIASTGIAQLPLSTPRNKFISLDKGILTFSLPAAAPVIVEIFDVKGILQRKIVTPHAPAGVYRCNIAEKARASGLLLVNAIIGNEGMTFRYLPLHNGRYSSHHDVATVSAGRSGLAKVTAVDDSLKVTAENYTEKVIAITSYDQVLDITLDTLGGEGARRSAGCGKTTTREKNKDIYETISSGGANREYIVRLPADYDPDTAYKLWFSLHCANGTASGVAAGSEGTGYQYYGIWKFANPDNGKGTTVFCAPQGIDKLWSNPDDRDVEFIRALVKKFESELCIDESRIFSEGFSMGGAMSYTLGCAMPDTFKAVCMHEGGGLPMCNRSYRGPVAMFITHATDDSWPGAGAPQLSDFAEQAECTPMDVPGMINPTPDLMHPVCVEYENCVSGAPCRACIFTGGHTPSPGTEGAWGEGNTWVDDSTWSYFKRFY